MAGVLSMGYVYPYTKEINFSGLSDYITLGYDRPFVYRQLIPFILREFLSVGIPLLVGLSIVTALSGIILFLGIHNFTKNTVSSLLIFSVGLILFIDCVKPYDLPTAAMFLLAYSFYIQDEYWKYYILLPFIILNRETAFLAIIFSLLYKFSWKSLIYQGGMFMLLQGFLHIIFRDNPGRVAYFTLLSNFNIILSDSAAMWIHIIGLGSVVFIILFFHTTDRFRFSASVVITLSVLLYMFFGVIYEIRVFWEIYPLLIIFVSFGKDIKYAPALQEIQPS